MNFLTDMNEPNPAHSLNGDTPFFLQTAINFALDDLTCWFIDMLSDGMDEEIDDQISAKIKEIAEDNAPWHCKHLMLNMDKCIYGIELMRIQEGEEYINKLLTGQDGSMDHLMHTALVYLIRGAIADKAWEIEIECRREVESCGAAA